MSRKVKTKNNPEGRFWPNEVILDVGSSMPYDVYGVRKPSEGIAYIRKDIHDELKTKYWHLLREFSFKD